MQNVSQKYFPWLYLTVGLVSFLNNLLFKRYIQKWTLRRVLIIIMTSELLGWFMEWLVIEIIELEEPNTVFLWDRKILNLSLKNCIFRSYHYLGETNFYMTNMMLRIPQFVCINFQKDISNFSEYETVYIDVLDLAC